MTTTTEQMREALKPFAKAYDDWRGDNASAHFNNAVCPADFKRAAEAMDAALREVAPAPQELTDDNARQVLQNVRNCLERINTQESAITDTLWYSDHQTLFDYIDAALERLPATGMPDAVKRIDAPQPEALCPACKGNDADMPCAYPSEGAKGCLRDKRLAAPAQQEQAPQPMTDEKILDLAMRSNLGVVQQGLWIAFQAHKERVLKFSKALLSRHPAQPVSGPVANDDKEINPDELEPRELLASRLISAWCDHHGKKIPWAKAIEISAIITKMPDDEKQALLAMDYTPVAQDTLKQQNAELVKALTEVKWWFEAERKSISKGNGSQWSMLQCTEQIENIDAAIASAHQETK